jgi:hypothetical protein
LSARFVIDTSSLIRLSQENPKPRYPKIWDSIETLIEKGFLRAPREVRLELERGDDELSDWAKGRIEFFVDPDRVQTEFLEEVLRKFPTLVDPDRTSPFADPWVVALALCWNSSESGPAEDRWIVVTEERPKGTGSTKIPDVCAAFGLECINLIGLFSLA